jgi:transcriptional regulator GlxA family with amidase domain
MPDTRRPLVCLLAAQATAPSVLYGLYDVLATAGAVYAEMTTGQAGEALLDVKIVAAQAAPFRCAGGIPVEPHASIDTVAAPDVALVCDLFTPIDTPPRGVYDAEIAWLQRLHRRDTLIASVCSGSLLLAEAGLLDGLDAAGHWGYRHLFRDHYPAVRWREDAILCRSGERDRIVTAASVTAWQDLALYLIARLCGPMHAIQAAKVFLLSPHTDGQLPFAAMTRLVQRSDAVVQDCQVWFADNYPCTNPVAQMTGRSGLSARTFARRFRAATGYLPIDYVHAIRIEEAKQLLETGSQPIDEVGRAVGYEDPASFRRLFKRVAGMTPGSYRRRFAHSRWA